MDDEFYIKEAITFAEKTNKVWPFSAILVDNTSGDILIKATDAAHISPIFHAESYTVHLVATRYSRLRDTDHTFTLYTTAEPDPLSTASIFWANTLGFAITRVVYGSPIKIINALWQFGNSIDSKALNTMLGPSTIRIEGPYLETICFELFQSAHLYQKLLNLKRPSQVLSQNLQDFCEVNCS